MDFDVRPLMGWTVCGRCKNHWNDDTGWMEYRLDYQPTVLDIIHFLQRRYQYVYVRKWENPDTLWAAWIATVDEALADQDPTALEVLAQFNATTQMDALKGLLLSLHTMREIP